MSNSHLPNDFLDESPSSPEDGIALCMSGGGYRAMLFHAGAVWRLNELGILHQLKRISSVSGGSITSAVLGVEWTNLGWHDANGLKIASPRRLMDQVIGPLRKMASTTVDVSSVIWGTINPFRAISEEVSERYDDTLFNGKTLQDLPRDSQGPRFVINATNVRTGSLWRFSRPYMADYRVGVIENPTTSLADAVTASSAFPPVLSPMRLRLDPASFRSGIPAHAVEPSSRSEAILTDGGVYDNLGLETAWKRYKTILVSDGGRKMDDDLSPATDWAMHSRRLLDLLQHQTSSLRRRQALDAFTSSDDPHDGTYFGIQTDIAEYQLSNTLPCPHSQTLAIASIPTRLSALRPTEQEQLINWGYAVSDAAIRKYIPQCQSSAPPAGFPYPMTGLA